MALRLTGEEFELIRDAFLDIDVDEDGSVTQDQLKGSFTKSLPDEKVNFYLKMLDMDGTGTIKFVDFLEMYAFLTLQKQPHETQMRQLFKALDKDDSGSISEHEVKSFCKMFQLVEDTNIDTAIDGLISKADTDGDGEINYVEFITMFNKLRNLGFFDERVN